LAVGVAGNIGTQTEEINELCTILEYSNASRSTARYDNIVAQ